MDINNKSGGLEGIAFTYGKPAITKVGKSENARLACERYKLDGKDGQMVKDKFK